MVIIMPNDYRHGPGGPDHDRKLATGVWSSVKAKKGPLCQRYLEKITLNKNWALKGGKVAK